MSHKLVRRIWAVSEYYHPNFSGAAIQAHQILAGLVRRGFSVNVLTAADQAAAGWAGSSRELDGVRIHYLPVVRQRDWHTSCRWPSVRGRLNALNRTLRDFSFHYRVLQLLRRAGRCGDIVQWYVVGDGAWPVFRVVRSRGLRNVIQVSLIGSDDPMSFCVGRIGLAQRGKRACFEIAECIIGLSNALVDSCLAVGINSNRVVRIPNGIDRTHFYADEHQRPMLCDKLGLDAARRYVVFVGSALHRKGIDVAVAAFIEFARRRPNVNLLLVGPCKFDDSTRHPPERKRLVEQLRQTAIDAGCADRVRWLDYRDNVADYLRVADLLFFPTRREGLPNAVAEAMACGLPVLASRLPGITTDLIDDGIHGQLLDGFEPRAYSECLHNLFTQPERLKQMGDAGRRRIEADYDLERITDQYAALYEQLPD